MSTISNKLILNERFNQELPADPIQENTRRQVKEAAFSYATPIKTANPQLLTYSKEVLDLIGLSEADTQSEEFTQIFTGNKLIKNTSPYAMCYGGH
ncbi:MAG: hypothetical protein AAGJ18_24990, partial [Bacteroidota bacterium]